MVAWSVEFWQRPREGAVLWQRRALVPDEFTTIVAALKFARGIEASYPGCVLVLRRNPHLGMGDEVRRERPYYTPALNQI